MLREKMLKLKDLPADKRIGFQYEFIFGKWILLCSSFANLELLIPLAMATLPLTLLLKSGDALVDPFLKHSTFVLILPS